MHVKMINKIDLFKQRYITWKDNSDKTIVNLVSKAKYLNDSNAYYENKRLLEAQNARRYLHGC